MDRSRGIYAGFAGMGVPSRYFTKCQYFNNVPKIRFDENTASW